jgi:ABC-type glycerol-3-phosphate transport system permease component
MNLIRALVIVPWFVLASLPLAWLALTSVKTYDDTISTHAKFVPWTESGSSERSPTFEPTLDAYRSLSKPVAGTPRDFYHYLGNSVIIGLLSTLAAVSLGTLCAYGFSRFELPGSKDWLFFILSTRFLPPLAVVVPVVVMYRWFSLENTHALLPVDRPAGAAALGVEVLGRQVAVILQRILIDLLVPVGQGHRVTEVQAERTEVRQLEAPVER